jgi:deazaflavin-dependent oxidoreductase (nitroreductase family)
MTFESRNGTRGARQPTAGPLMRYLNTVVVRRIRKKGHAMGRMNTLVLTTIGKKSGEPRETPVGWFPGEGGSWLIVASAAGAPKNPAWYYNLAANPDKVIIEVDGRKIPVVAEQLHGSARETAWESVVAAAPRFGQYAVKTDRELPVIRLTARSAG